MKVQIISTTDGKFIGRTFNENDNPIILDDCNIAVDKKINNLNEIIFMNSNYIINTIKLTK